MAHIYRDRRGGGGGGEGGQIYQKLAVLFGRAREQMRGEIARGMGKR